MYFPSREAMPRAVLASCCPLLPERNMLWPFRSDTGEQRHEEAGPLPGDGFMGESPAPRRAVLMQTPLQDRQRRKNEQVHQKIKQ